MHPADEKPGRPLVVVRWGIPSGRQSAADEDAAEELAEELVPRIPAVADAEILGFDDARDRIDIVIWGEGTDEEIDQIYRPVWLPWLFRDGAGPYDSPTESPGSLPGVRRLST